VILLNLGREAYTIHAGDRIAQMVVGRYEAAEWVEEKLAGFGARRRRVSDRLVDNKSCAINDISVCIFVWEASIMSVNNLCPEAPKCSTTAR